MTSLKERPVTASRYRLFNALATAMFCLVLGVSSGRAQTTGSSSLSGVVSDATGAVVPGATVEIHNPVSQFSRSTTTDSAGRFSFPNLPFNPYHMIVDLTGFAPYSQDVDVRSAVPINLQVTLQIAGSAENVTVQAEATDLLENDPTFHTDVDRQLFDKLPLESSSSQLSSLVTLASPGVAADSNGLFHGMGDHAENSFSLDGQPITDQQSKVFSNQIPLDAVQSMTVIAGAPPAEFGDKTSLVIDVTTRSGLNSTTPARSRHGQLRYLRQFEPGYELLLRRQELGQLYLRRTDWTPAGSSIRRSSSFYTRTGTKRTCSTALTMCFRRKTPSTSILVLRVPGSRTRTPTTT